MNIEVTQKEAKLITELLNDYVYTFQRGTIREFLSNDTKDQINAEAEAVERLMMKFTKIPKKP